MIRGIRKQTRLFPVAALLFWAACSGSSGLADGDASNANGAGDETIHIEDYEDFDPTPYAENPPAAEPVEHDVPSTLLDGKPDRVISDTRAGYRIQIFASKEKAEADGRFEGATAWWRRQQRSGQLEEVYPGDPSTPQVYLVFRQPYYRVRVGNFATRAEAQATLDLIKERFPSAFLVPDTVTITR
ncbi:MAG: SPOR domain-containing protein [Rhodothermales bacterium]